MGGVTRGFCMHALLPDSESLHRIMIHWQTITLDNSMSDAVRRPFRACRTSNSIIQLEHAKEIEGNLMSANANR